MAIVRKEGRKGLKISLVITVLVSLKGAGFVCLNSILHRLTAILKYAMHYRVVTGECGISQLFWYDDNKRRWIYTYLLTYLLT